MRFAQNEKFVTKCVALVLWAFCINVRSAEAKLTSDTIGEPKSAKNNGISSNSRMSDHEYEYVSSWPILDRKLGSVSAVDLDSDGNVVIFHRASHVWSATSFNPEERYQNATNGPIAQPTVIKFNQRTGQILMEWGENLFYMPHGLTIDHEQNYWMTDVALHQVLKFDLKYSTKEPILSLGQRFEPGNDMDHFCKPTAVAVLDSGDFFVADGYCNGRIVKYSAEGQPLLSWGRNSFILTRTFGLPPGPVPDSFFAIPHSLTLATDRGLLCVADREQGRVQCFHTANGTFHSQYASSSIGSRIFSVKYIPVDGGLLYMINGPQFDLDVKPVQGFIVNMSTGAIVGDFRPNNLLHAFSNPHEIAISNDGGEIYVAELDPQIVHKFQRIGFTPKEPLNIVGQSGNLTVGKANLILNADAYIQDKFGTKNNSLTAGSIGIFSIVSSLLVTSLLLALMFRVLCYRQVNSSSRMDEIPLRTVDEV